MRDLLMPCLASLTAEAPLDWEVIVVVNGDDDGTVGAVRARFPQVRLIVNARNRGVGPARNQGMAVARAPFVILLDADTTVTPGSLTGLVDALRRTPEAAVIGPRLVSPSGERQGTARDFPTLLTKLRRRLPARFAQGLPGDAVPDGDRPVVVGYVIGACQAIRRTALDQVGPLDEAIFYGPEDVDLCLRMWKAGWNVVWDPRFTIVHHEQRLTRRRLLSMLTVRHAIALAYFFLKHGYLFRPPTYGAHPRFA